MLMNNDTPPTLQPLSQEPISQQPMQTPRKKRSFFSPGFKFVIAFLLGAIAYATGTGIYNFLNQEQKNATMRQEQQTQQSTSIQQPTTPYTPEQDQISTEELSKYVNPTDCSTEPSYSSLKPVYEKYAIENISLYDGLKIKNNINGFTVTWTQLPTVLDYQCKDIKITDLKANDRVTVYALKSFTGINGNLKDAKIIQKVTK